jgi:membrane associated rhomboid family serine protease
MSNFLWEYPVTMGVTLFLFVFYFLVSVFVPESIIIRYFVAYPYDLNVINIFLSIFYHASPPHLLSNAFFLFVLGRGVEDRLGKLKWMYLFLVAGFFSVVLDSLIRGFLYHEREPIVGASGAICGIAGASALLTPFSWKVYGKRIPFPIFLVSWLMIYSDLTNLFSRDKIAHWAHLAGFTSVLISGYFLSKQEREKLRNGFLVNLTFFLLSLILLFFVQNR